jgi:hypothetical protein
VPPLLLVSGTLPIAYKGSQYNIPIQFTIPEGYSLPPLSLYDGLHSHNRGLCVRLVRASCVRRLSALATGLQGNADRGT